MDGAKLTPREADVLRWVRRGETDVAIGRLLCISHRTVHAHLRNVFKKFGCHTRTAALYALRRDHRSEDTIDNPKTILELVVRRELQPALTGGHGAQPYCLLHLECGHRVTRRPSDRVTRRARCFECERLPVPARYIKHRKASYA